MTDNIKNRGKILWVDDEIDFLKSHILFLEKKGFDLTPVNSGEDALYAIKETRFDLILLDEMMSGLDGLTTLKRIKEIHPDLPVIMITKNEEEWLMEEAIGAQISNYLTKPVNPSQILLACKNILETVQIQSDKTTKDYLHDFQKISEDVDNAKDINDWYEIYGKFTDWALKFDQFGDQGLSQIMSDQFTGADQKFIQFISENYQEWMNAKDRPIFSPDIVKQYIKPILENDEQAVLIVIDSLRYDQWKSISDLLYPYFSINTDVCLSILPTATPYSRNAIFSGLFPDGLQRKYPERCKEMFNDETSMNRFESEFLKDQINRLGLKNKSVNYFKIITYKDGNKLEKRIKEYSSTDLLAIVVNFVDMLGHSRSESDVLKEMVPDESAYRSAVRSWMENVWLLNVLKEVSTWNCKVIITSDHGTVRVQKPVKVKGDKFTSSGIRYKHGKQLSVQSRHGLTIVKPSLYNIEQTDFNTNYIIAKGDSFFVYPTDYHRFVNKFINSFQHGGISMEEMIVPVAILEGKKS
jgi:CheY-like chemotaxis protein